MSKNETKQHSAIGNNANEKYQYSLSYNDDLNDENKDLRIVRDEDTTFTTKQSCREPEWTTPPPEWFTQEPHNPYNNDSAQDEEDDDGDVIKSQTQIPRWTVPHNGKPLGMAWYKFLIYFVLFAGAVANAIYGLGYLTGWVYENETNGQVTSAQVYAYYGETLHVVDILYGLALIGFAILAVVTRYKLAKYKSDAPKFVYIYYSLPIVASLLYAFLVKLLTGISITADQVISIITGAIILLANIRYFRRRSHLFFDITVPKTGGYSKYNFTQKEIADETTDTENIENGSDTQCYFCRKCGTRLMSDSSFCHICGTEVIK